MWRSPPTDIIPKRERLNASLHAQEQGKEVCSHELGGRWSIKYNKARKENEKQTDWEELKLSPFADDRIVENSTESTKKNLLEIISKLNKVIR